MSKAAKATLVRLWFALVSGALLLASAAHAQSDPNKLRSAIGAQARTVIEAQLEAFAKDDAPRAYSYAAPGLQAQFGSPENFMEMVRETYAPVYRPAAVKFLDPQTSDDRVLQPVSISDQNGKAWIAVYSLVRIPDTGWRIIGCQLFQQKGERGQRAALRFTPNS